MKISRKRADPYLVDYIIKFKHSLTNKQFIFDLFTNCQKIVIEDYTYNESDNTLIVHDKRFFNYCKGRLFSLSNHDSEYLFYIKDILNRDKYIIGTSKFKNKFEQIASIHDEFQLVKGMIPTFTDSKPITTTFGKFFYNYVYLYSIFNNLFPYNNDVFNPDKYEKQICKYAIQDKVTTNQIVTYANRLMFIASIADVFLPTISEKLLTTSKEFNQYKKELLEKYKDKLNDPATIIKIEDMLIAKDKELLKDDISSAFTKKKTFDTIRKKMFLSYGYVQQFGDDNLLFAKTTLDEGWKKEELPTLFNDTRIGSYFRGVNTAKGGALAKYLARVFQYVQITEDDCKSKEGIEVLITQDNYNDYLYRYVIINNKPVELTEDTIKKFINKVITIRSPKHCKTKDGYCFTCMGSIYKKLNYKRLVSEPLKVGFKFMGLSMQAMHGVKLKVLNIENIDEFVI